MSNTDGLSKAERVELSQRATRVDDARRVSFILLLEAAQIREKLSCNDAFIDRWSERFIAERLSILEWTVKRKPPAATHRARGSSPINSGLAYDHRLDVPQAQPKLHRIDST